MKRNYRTEITKRATDEAPQAFIGKNFKPISNGDIKDLVQKHFEDPANEGPSNIKPKSPEKIRHDELAKRDRI